MASDEFSALGHGLRRHSERNSWNKRRARSRSGCISQSTDDWALRLHSCRALSSQSQNYGRPNIIDFKSGFDKPHTWLETGFKVAENPLPNSGAEIHAEPRFHISH